MRGHAMGGAGLPCAAVVRSGAPWLAMAGHGPQRVRMASRGTGLLVDSEHIKAVLLGSLDPLL